MKKLLLGLLSGFFVSTSFSQDAQVISSLGDDIANAQLTLSQTLGEIAVTDLSGSGVVLEQGFHNAIPKIGVQLSVRAFLQGAYDENIGLLRDDLRALNFIPQTSPYIDALSVASPSVFATTGNDAIVDWVFVEVRDRNLSDLVVAEQSALMQRDGDIVGLDGVSPLTFDIYPGTYFLSISHRNHLGIISNTTETIANDSFVLDFTDGSVAAKGGINGRSQFSDGAIALIAGNVNSDIDSVVRFAGANNDNLAVRNGVLTNPGNIFSSQSFNILGYNILDANMNGRVSFTGGNNDALFILNVVRTAQGNIFGSQSFQLIQQF